MDAPEFAKAAIDPDRWLSKSASLRRSANRLWDSFFECTLRGSIELQAKNTELGERFWAEAIDYLTASKFLYGLSVETAFKADVLRRRPEAVELRLSTDGIGKIKSAELKQLGVQLGSGHDLEELAQQSGILTLPGNPVFKVESDIAALREILRHLSEIIYWSGRYPVPTRSGKRHEPSPEIPAKVFGHYIRDWLDPLLDHFQGPHAPPDDFAESMARITSLVRSPGQAPEQQF